MIGLLSAAIAGLALGTAAIEVWIARRGLAWLGRRTGGAVLVRESERIRQLAWRGGARSALALAAALGGATALSRLGGPLLLLPIAVVLPTLLDVAVLAWIRYRRGTREWHAFFREYLRLFYREALQSVPVAAAVGWVMPETGWWMVAWAGFAVTLVLREAAPLSGRILSKIEPGPLAKGTAMVLHRSGLEGTTVRIANGSQQSGGMNARAQGIVARRSIILDATLVAGMPTEQVLAVVAHEAGHLAGYHREWFTVWRLTIGLGAVFAIAQLGGGDAPHESVAILLLALPALGLLVRPVETWLIRRWESAADRHAANLAGARLFAEALKRLFGANLAAPEPEPVWASFHHPHPPPARRLDRLAGPPCLQGSHQSI